MKRTAQKWIAAALALILALSVFAFAASAAQTAIPTIYIHGYGAPIYADENSTDNQIYPVALPEDFLSQIIKKARKPFAKGALFGQWDDFHNLVIDELTALFGPAALDHNGKASNGSGNPIFYKGEPLSDEKNEEGKYDLHAYWFEYDWRLDPFVLAKKLNKYIKEVRKATGAKKVNLIGRCYGANVILAYLDSYGFDRVQSVCFYSAGFNGFEHISALFTGNLEVDPDTLTAYFDTAGRHELIGEEEDPAYEFVVALLQYLNAIKALDVGEKAMESYFIPEFKQYILPQLMRNTFATMPGIWSFVSSESYEEAKQVIFGGYEKEYAGVIAKADRYHERVTSRVDEILLAAVAAGVRVYDIVKYGYMTIPIVADGDAMSDDTVFTSNSSLGAKTSSVYGTLDDSFIEGVKAGNGGKYLSPDKQIDASTCLLPDHTWFLKHVYHPQNPEAVEEMMATLLNYKGYATVFDLKQYPQYLDYDSKNDTLSPLQAEEPPQAPTYSYFKSLHKLMKSVIQVLKARNAKA